MVKGYETIKIYGHGNNKTANKVLDDSPGIIKGIYVTIVGGTNKGDDRVKLRDGESTDDPLLLTTIRPDTTHNSPYESLNIAYEKLYGEFTWGTQTSCEITLTVYKGEI